MHLTFSRERSLLRLRPVLILCAVMASLLGLSSCTSNHSLFAVGNEGNTTASAGQSQWVVGWGTSPQNALRSAANPGGSEQSFRFILVPTIDANEERVHFSNLMGKTPVTIGAARLAAAVDVGPAIDTKRDIPLTFNREASVTIPAGQEVISDPVNISYQYGEKLAVSVYLKGTFGPLTAHSSEVQTNFATPVDAGDATSDAAGTSFKNTNTEWLMLTGVDVYGPYQGTVAFFGSSSVDGHASNYGDTNSYPAANFPITAQDNDRPTDWLARRLIASGYRMGVLNAGELGDPAGEDNTTASGSSLAGVDRINHDVLQQAGIKTVVIYFGGIDLRADCKPASDVEASLTNMVQQAQQAGVRVILATLPPSEYCTSDAGLVPTSEDPYTGDLNPGPENPGSTQRRALNDWIRTSGAQLPGVVAIADFDKALLDPNHPDFMQPNLNSGDNFHPNGQGYGVQSASIPLKAILGF
jgi:lysophospholipase L1-like esterase